MKVFTNILFLLTNLFALGYGISYAINEEWNTALIWLSIAGTMTLSWIIPFLSLMKRLATSCVISIYFFALFGYEMIYYAIRDKWWFFALFTLLTVWFAGNSFGFIVQIVEIYRTRRAIYKELYEYGKKYILPQSPHNTK